MPDIIEINDENFEQFIDRTGDDGLARARGCVPRPYDTHPVGCYASMPVFSLPLMTDAEIEVAIKRKDAEQSWLQNVRDVGMFGGRIPSRDQNGKGYCWAHSGVSANLLVRARDNQPYEDLSAYAVACIIKGYRDEGGWGQEGVQWEIDHGVPTSKTWPQQSMSRSNDNAAMRAEAALYKPTGTWMDMQSRDRRALATALCRNDPVVVDFDWWSHSVCACRLKAWGTNGSSLKITIWNSWGDSWSDGGMGDLSGNRAVPDSQVALVTTRIAA